VDSEDDHGKTAGEFDNNDDASVDVDIARVDAGDSMEVANWEGENTGVLAKYADHDGNESITTDNQAPTNGDREKHSYDAEINDEEDVHHEETLDEDVYHPDTMPPSVQYTYGTRPQHHHDYSHMHATIVPHTMTQYSLKSGLKKLKEKQENAISKELLQLYLRDKFTLQDSMKLSASQKTGTLESIMFLKEK
jgi:hypothetical protein